MQEGQGWPKKINDSVWEFCKPKDPSVEIIFFHGIQLRRENTEVPHLSTWTTKSDTTQYWPQTFFSSDEFLTNERIQVRALTAAYDGSRLRTDTKGRLDPYNLAENFIETIIDNPRVKVGQTKGVPLILVGHSFGGLLIKMLVGQAADRLIGDNMKRVRSFLDNLAGVFFYSTPHSALRTEVFEQLFPSMPNVQYSDLVSLFKELNKHAARLEADMQNHILIQGKKWGGIKLMEVFEAEETDLGHWTGKIVEEASARGTFIREDHFNICRPEDTTSDSYQKLATFIYNIHEESKRPTDADIDIDLP